MTGELNGNQDFASPQDALAHYGVKGMRWGIRKEDRPGGPRTGGAAELKKLDAFAKEESGAILEQAGVGPNPTYSRNRRIFMAAGLTLGVAAVAAGGYYAYSRSGAMPAANQSAADKFTANFHTGLNKQLTKKLPPLDQLDDNDLTLPSSTIFRRVTGRANEPISDSHMYVSHLDEDVDRYVGVFSKVVKGRAGEAHLSEIKMRTSVSSPSLKKRVDIMKGMLNEVDRDPKSLTEGMSFREVLIESTAAARAKAYGDSSDKHESALSRMSDDDLVRETYGTFVNSMGGQINNPQYRVSHASSYLDKVRNMGYNALVDDANVGVLARSPLMLLTPQRSIESRTSKPITDQQVNTAREQIKLFNDDLAIVRHGQKFDTPAMAAAAIQAERRR